MFCVTLMRNLSRCVHRCVCLSLAYAKTSECKVPIEGDQLVPNSRGTCTHAFYSRATLDWSNQRQNGAGRRQTMTATILQELRELASVDLFAAGRREDTFVGRPFYLDFSFLRMVSNDKWKNNVGGLPAGAFLLCFYEGEPGIDEAL